MDPKETIKNLSQKISELMDETGVFALIVNCSEEVQDTLHNLERDLMFSVIKNVEDLARESINQCKEVGVNSTTIHSASLLGSTYFQIEAELYMEGCVAIVDISILKIISLDEFLDLMSHYKAQAGKGNASLRHIVEGKIKNSIS
jgi:hypothetical protein